MGLFRRPEASRKCELVREQTTVRPRLNTDRYDCTLLQVGVADSTLNRLTASERRRLEPETVHGVQKRTSRRRHSNGPCGRRNRQRQRRGHVRITLSTLRRHLRTTTRQACLSDNSVTHVRPTTSVAAIIHRYLLNSSHNSVTIIHRSIIILRRTSNHSPLTHVHLSCTTV